MACGSRWGRAAAGTRATESAFLDERIVPAESRDGRAELLRAALQEHEPDVIRRVVELDGALKVNSRGITVGDPIRGDHHGLLTADPRGSHEAHPRGPNEVNAGSNRRTVA